MPARPAGRHAVRVSSVEMTDKPVAMSLTIPRAEQLRRLLRATEQPDTQPLLTELDQALADARRALAARRRALPNIGLRITRRRDPDWPVAVSGDLRLALGYQSHAFAMEADVAAAAETQRLPVQLDCDYRTFYAAVHNQRDACRLIALLRSMIPAE